LVAAAKFLVAATNNLFFVPNFAAVTKPFFFRACTPERLKTQPSKFKARLMVSARIRADIQTICANADRADKINFYSERGAFSLTRGAECVKRAN